MNVLKNIQTYIAGQAEPKRSDMQTLHGMILALVPEGRLWFLDGKDEAGKTVSNPNVGYGLQTLKYADGKTKEFYQIGFSANTTGISVYILGLEDKKFLINAYGKTLGKASITGYCIKFKALKDIHLDVLQEAMREGIAQTGD
jgi:hypothetical protein